MLYASIHPKIHTQSHQLIAPRTVLHPSKVDLFKKHYNSHLAQPSSNLILFANVAVNVRWASIVVWHLHYNALIIKIIARRIDVAIFSLVIIVQTHSNRNNYFIKTKIEQIKVAKSREAEFHLFSNKCSLAKNVYRQKQKRFQTNKSLQMFGLVNVNKMCFIFPQIFPPLTATISPLWQKIPTKLVFDKESWLILKTRVLVHWGQSCKKRFK